MLRSGQMNPIDKIDPEALALTLRYLLRRYMKSTKMQKQADFAVKLGFSAQQLSNLLHGRTRVKEHHLLSFAHAFGVSPEQILYQANLHGEALAGAELGQKVEKLEIQLKELQEKLESELEAAKEREIERDARVSEIEAKIAMEDLEGNGPSSNGGLGASKPNLGGEPSE